MNYNDRETVPPVWQVGDVILDRYEVTQVFTSGAMGLVYRVHHLDWNIDLAVKSPRPEFFQSPNQIENFEREAETWVNIGLHPHIVSCYYIRRLGGIPRVFAEFVEDGTLSDWIRTKRLYEDGEEKALERIIDVAIQSAWGLRYAHEKGLVHQDVKPGNVLLLPDGSAKVSDFGLTSARRASAESSAVAPRPGQSTLVPGSGFMTREYASPEQLRGEHLSRKTDVWSWAVSLLEMLLGELTWTSGLAAPAVLEDLDRERFDKDIVLLLCSCFGSRSCPRWTSFEPVIEALTKYYGARFGAFRRMQPHPAQFLADALNNRGASFVDLGKATEALTEFEKALHLHATHFEANYNHGLLLWRTGELSDVDFLRRLDSLVWTQPVQWKIFYYLGLVQLERGEPEAAKTALQAAAEVTDNERDLFTIGTARSLIPRRNIRRCPFTTQTETTYAVCLDQDGRYAVSGGRAVRLWDVETGACVRRFGSPDSDVTFGVCLSSDGRHILSNTRRALQWWDTATGECLRTIDTESSINCLCLSSDNSWALTGHGGPQSNDEYSPVVGCALKTWDLGTGRCMRVVDAQGGAVRSACLSRDGKWGVAAAGGTLQLWGEESRCFEDYGGQIGSVALSSDNRFVLSSDLWNGTMRLWDVASGKCLRKFQTSDRFVSFLDSNRWAVSAEQRAVGVCWLRLWDLSTGQCLRSFECNSLIEALCTSEDNFRVLTADITRSSPESAPYGELKLWDLRDLTRERRSHAPLALSKITTVQSAVATAAQFERELKRAQTAVLAEQWTNALEHAKAVRAIPGFEFDQEALNASNEAGLHSYRKRLLGVSQSWRFNPYIEDAFRGWLSPDGSRVAALGKDETLRVLDRSTGQSLSEFYVSCREVSEESEVIDICLSNDNEFALVGGGYDESEHNCGITWNEPILQLWNLKDGEIVDTLWEHHRWVVTSVCLTRDDRWVLACRSDGALRLFDVTTGICLRKFDGDVKGFDTSCMSGDGAWVLTADRCFDRKGDCLLRLWSVVSGECVRMFDGHAGPVHSMCLSRDNRWAISGGADRTLRVWDTVNGQCLRAFEGHTAPITSVCISVDMRWAISASVGCIRFWELTGRCVHTMKVPCTSVFLSPDSRWLLSSGPLRLWELDWEFEKREAADWDEGARSYLLNFLSLHTGFAAEIPKDREATPHEITLALMRHGRPSWTEEDFKKLLCTLAYAGYGWVRPEGVRRELDAMAAVWQGPPTLSYGA